jgi:hypothetical protein
MASGKRWRKKEQAEDAWKNQFDHSQAYAQW